MHELACSSGTVAPSSWSTTVPDAWQPLGAVLAGVLVSVGSRVAVGSGAPWPPGSGTGL